MAAASRKSVLFVCLGNICRSTMAEAIFLHLIEERGQTEQWQVDSAAIGDWNIGELPDERGMAVLKDNRIKNYTHRARQIRADDFKKFDTIFGMDHKNMSDLSNLKPKDSKAELKMLGNYDPKKETIIEDPYFKENIAAFEKVYSQCYRSCQAFLDSQSQR